jgi:hypothetical protein
VIIITHQSWSRPNGKLRFCYSVSFHAIHWVRIYHHFTFRIDPRCAIAAGVVFGVPAAATAVGFGAAGIGAGTLAAKMMSWTAIFSGGGVSSWSLVAFLQSLGASGLASFAMTPAGQALIAAGCLIPWVILEEDEWMILMSCYSYGYDWEKNNFLEVLYCRRFFTLLFTSSC